MKNKIEKGEIEKLNTPNGIISLEVGKVVNGYGNHVNTLITMNGEQEVLPFEVKLAEKLGVGYKLREFMRRIGTPANDESYLLKAA